MGLDDGERDAEYLTLDEVREELRSRKKYFASQADMARHIGVWPSFVGNFLSGTRLPGSRVLEYLGLEEVTVYRRKKPPT